MPRGGRRDQDALPDFETPRRHLPRQAGALRSRGRSDELRERGGIPGGQLRLQERLSGAASGHAERIRAAVAKKLGVDAVVVVKSAQEVAGILAGNKLGKLAS